MVVKTLWVHHQRGLSFICNPYDPSDVEMASMSWLFYLSKGLDFVDTGTSLCCLPQAHDGVDILPSASCAVYVP
jgi:hypothetical protein